MLFQVVVWQKTKVADNRSALLATLGPSVVANLLQCHQQQEEPEVSEGRNIPNRGSSKNAQCFSAEKQVEHFRRTFYILCNLGD